MVSLGKYRSIPSKHSLRLIEVYLKYRWHSYLTNVLDPRWMNIKQVVFLYERRWH